MPGHVPSTPLETMTRNMKNIENVLTRMENKLGDVKERLEECQQNVKNIKAEEERSEEPLP